MNAIRDYACLAVERTVFRSHRRSASAAVRKRQWRRAVSDFEYIVSRTGGRLGVGSTLRLARAYLKMSSRDEARTLLRGALSRFPGEPRLRGALLAIEAQAGNMSEVERLWREGPAGSRLSASAYASIIRALRRHWRNEEAIHIASEALSAFPGSNEILAAFHEVMPSRRHVYVIIRYSLLTMPGMSSWRLGRNVDFDTYRRNLFDPQRLVARHRIFQHVTMPSLIAQELPEAESMTVLVLTSSSLPEAEREELDRLAMPYSWMRIHGLREDESVLEQLRRILEADLRTKVSDEPIAYASVWLDDDDALARNYVKAVWRYIDPKLSGICITFADGYHGVWDEGSGRLTSHHTCHSPNIALGLAQINAWDASRGFANDACTIYHAGNLRHRYIHRRAPTIVDTRMPMYYRTHHASSDLNRVSVASRLQRLFRHTESVPRDDETIARAVGLDQSVLETRSGGPAEMDFRSVAKAPPGQATGAVSPG